MFRRTLFTMIAVMALLIPFAGMAASGPQQEINNFTLKDYNGKSYSLADFNKSKAIVVMFVATQCPVSNAYNTRMAALFNDYKDKHIAFVGINSNKQENISEIKQHAIDHHLDFPILKDWDNLVADEFKATVTPEIFVLNSDFGLLYHGRIDDSRREKNVESYDLRKALDKILAGEKVVNTETKAFGCSIKQVEK